MATSTNGVHAVAAEPTWQQIHGSDNWDGLLSPLNIKLRREIVRYGDFITAISDGINNVEESKLRLYPLYGKSVLFSAVGLHQMANSYTITRYLYSTIEKAEEGGSRTYTYEWMGLIAVSRDAETRKLGRRDIVISFRGSMGEGDASYDLDAEVAPFPNLEGSTVGAPLVHKGFLALYNTAPPEEILQQQPKEAIATESLRLQVVNELRSLLGKYSGGDEPVSVTVVGYSQGAALASLCAYDIANNQREINASSNAQLAAFTYGGPRVGGFEFRLLCDEFLKLKVLRVVDSRDIVPQFLPPLVPFIYEHHGVQLLVDGSQSTYVKPFNIVDLDYINRYLAMAHDMEGYLHTVAGISGPVTTTNFPAVDQLAAPFIGGDAQGQRLYDALKKRFSGDLKGLLQFVQQLLKVVNKKTPATTTEKDAVADGFRLRVERDFALVNKRADLLKDEYGIHQNWWVVRNKAMLQMRQMDGTWIWRPAYFDLVQVLISDPDFH